MQTTTLRTDTPAALEQAVAEAVRLLGEGEPVAVPSETVYGLAADALNPAAAARIFEAKERPSFDPLICHLPDLAWLPRMAALPAESRALVEQLTTRFWPGPLTLILPRQAIVPDLVTSGLETVALRMPAHPVFSALLQRFGQPLAAPSANRFGRISPTAAEHVLSELEGRIPLILDGGATLHGLESTIVAVEGARLRILRNGPVTREELEAFGEVQEGEAALGTHPEAPGQLPSHYAPRTPMHWLHGMAGPKDWFESSPPPQRIGLLAFRMAATAFPFAAWEVLSPTGDLREAAATLFAKMRRLDESGLDLILAEAVPEVGLGRAIMDRLRKACVR